MATQMPMMPPVMPPVQIPPMARRPRAPIKPQYTQKVDADPSIPPNQTIYIKNLNDRVPLRLLKLELRRHFEKFGTILDLVAMSSFWRRGQAWIVYQDIESATKALNEMQGYMLHGHAIQINYALQQSDVVTKANGTYVQRPSGPKKPRAIVAREAKQQQLFKDMQNDFAKGNLAGQVQSALVGTTATLPGAATSIGAPTPATIGEPSLKRPRGFAMQAPSAGVGPLANRTLFVEKLPPDATTESVKTLFENMPGLVEVRVIASRCVAFVDFNNEINSTYALSTLQGATLNGCNIQVSFAKH